MKTSDERISSIKNKVKSKRRQRAIVWTSTVTACVLVALTVVCSLSILGEDVPPINAYKNDEYYPLIEKINEKYASFGDQTASSSEIANSISPGNPNMYEETTINQVDGVIEGDVLKRSTTHAFYLKTVYRQYVENYLQLQIYKLAGNDTWAVSKYDIREKDGTRFVPGSAVIKAEMFINDDATRLTVIFLCLNERGKLITTVVSLDISDVENVTEVNRVYVSGYYESSRLTNGKLLVITRYIIYNYGDVDYDKKETYVPQCGSTLNTGYVPMRNIYVPDYCGGHYYTVLALLDETTLEVQDSYAIFSYSQDIYVSRDYLVFMYNRYLSAQIAEMVVLKHKDGFEKTGEICLDGYIKDRYSMDEKDGVLRVFVTPGQWKSAPHMLSFKDTSVSLYCVNLDTMQIVASKERFAPAGDEVKSARFDGDKAYVCTARGVHEVIDPVFYFDLSDLNNITCVDTGEMSGFSFNLIKFNELLLGIGQREKSNSLKVELYAETEDDNAENGVESVAVFERKCTYSREHKAHFVDAEHNLIGLSIIDSDPDWLSSNPNTSLKYLLLSYDAETKSLAPVYFEVFDSYNELARAFYAHNGVYVFGTNAFAFIDLQ